MLGRNEKWVSTTSTAVPSGSSQKRVDTCLNNASSRHYTILFNTILTMIMEDMALLKIEALVEMQRRNGLGISESKVNNKAASPRLTTRRRVQG